jgi:hypothetical protein
MIRFDGYYVSDPVFFKDGVANYSYSGFSHNAYFFKKEGQFLRSTKNSETKDISFSHSDFNPDFPNKYEIKGDKLEMFFETGKEWEFSEVFEVVSPEKIKGEKRELHFVKFK